MEWDAWMKGFLLGLSIAAPVGPIGLLCIKRTLSGGWLAGLVTGMGAATADFCYGLIAALGLAAASFIEGAQWVRWGGAVFLLYLGVRTFFEKPAAREAQVSGGALIKDYATTFVLTLSNPMTILSFAAMFAALGTGGGWRIAAGVFVGSATWWVFLSSAASLFRGRMTDRAFTWVNRAAGVALVVFAAIAALG